MLRSATTGDIETHNDVARYRMKENTPSTDVEIFHLCRLYLPFQLEIRAREVSFACLVNLWLGFCLNVDLP